MAKNTPHEGNLYDKIFKENAESIFIRKLGELTIKITTEMPVNLNYDVESDFLYLQGIEKGIEKGVEKEREKAQLEKIETAKKMLLAGLTEAQVAEFLELPISEVKTIKKKLD